MTAKTPAKFTSYLAPLYLDIALNGIVLYDTVGSPHALPPSVPSSTGTAFTGFNAGVI